MNHRNYNRELIEAVQKDVAEALLKHKPGSAEYDSIQSAGFILLDNLEASGRRLNPQSYSLDPSEIAPGEKLKIELNFITKCCGFQLVGIFVSSDALGIFLSENQDLSDPKRFGFAGIVDIKLAGAEDPVCLLI